MALPSTGPISLANVNVELGLSSTTTISLNQTNVRTLAGVASGTISMSDLRGKSAGGTFDPDGGTTVGEAVFVDDYGETYAELTISCTQNAVWTYSGGGTGASVSVTSGGTATSITFSVSSAGAPRLREWQLQATSGSTTRYWDVYLELFGFA
jgi:hypothetical protein